MNRTTMAVVADFAIRANVKRCNTAALGMRLGVVIRRRLSNQLIKLASIAVIICYLRPKLIQRVVSGARTRIAGIHELLREASVQLGCPAEINLVLRTTNRSTRGVCPVGVSKLAAKPGGKIS